MERLVAQLERARRLGFLGPGEVQAHVGHSAGFLAALEKVVEGSVVVDLGSGGGVPGLVIAVARPDLHLVLVDAMVKRCQFLEGAISELEANAEVVQGRAEEIGRGPLRGTAAVVVARSFGPPATTAECAAPLLLPGGLLVVSEPPDEADRWPVEGLAELGLSPVPRSAGGPNVQILRQGAPCPDRFPRRNGIPAKRPLF